MLWGNVFFLAICACNSYFFLLDVCDRNTVLYVRIKLLRGDFGVVILVIVIFLFKYFGYMRKWINFVDVNKG